MDLKKDTFQDPGSQSGQGRQYPYTAAEAKTNDFYGAGCYSVCMKPSGVSGISSSFYIHSGAHDVPSGFFDSNPLHNEIDIEFIGKDTRGFQSNYFSRYFNPNANSGSGNELWHTLDFDASQRFHMYSFKWTAKGIQWFVDGRHVRSALADQTRIPSPGYSPMRIVTNIWAVNKQAEEWAGPLDKTVYSTSSAIKWISHEAGDGCNIPTQTSCS
jgi:endo-1,3-1,4-beta-glycanase ExoK